MESKTAAVLFTGGKDSCLALHKVLKAGFDVKYLLCINPENPDSYMFHKPDLNLLKKQAELLGIELLVASSKGEKEEELLELEELIRTAKIKENFNYLVIGGIASSYQGSRIKTICDKIGLKVCAPLWDYTPKGIWCELLDEGFKVVLIKIACEGIPKEFLGKIIDWKMFEELKMLSKKFGFRIDFEGGEAESAVLWMPEFGKIKGIKNELKITFDVISEGKYNHYLKIKELKI